MNFNDWLNSAIKTLNNDNAHRDAEILLCFVTKKERAFIKGFNETLLDSSQLLILNQLLRRRASGEPIAYILGQKEFWSLPLFVSPITLIPRPDTECLVECALKKMPLAAIGTVLDLGTGTGAIAIALAKERPRWQVVGIDKTIPIVELAKTNANNLAITNITFYQSDWFASVNNKNFDLIVSNPPYIDENDQHLLQSDVRFEPRSALVAENQGLADLMYIMTQASKYLHNGGWLILEHGWQQGQSVREYMHKAGFRQVITEQDYAGKERVTLGCFICDV